MVKVFSNLYLFFKKGTTSDNDGYIRGNPNSELPEYVSTHRCSSPLLPLSLLNKKGQTFKVKCCYECNFLFCLYKPRLHFHRLSHPPARTSINIMVKPPTLLVIMTLCCCLFTADGEIVNQN